MAQIVSRDSRRKISARTGFAAVVIVVATLAAYFPALRGGFIWDDDAYVTQNPLIRSPDGLWKIWFVPRESPSQYFPLVYTTFRAEYSLWKLNPLGYHLVNVLLHVGNALLIWRFLGVLRVRGAWLAAAIFALHPVQVESVAWITERKNVLSTFLYLLALLAWIEYLSHARLRMYLTCLLLFIFALFAKTTACTLPGVLLLLHWLRREPIGIRAAMRIAPFVVIGMAMGLLAMWIERVKQGTTGAAFQIPPADRLLIACRALWFYAGKLLVPIDLTFSYPKWRIDSSQPSQWLWVIATAATGGLLWRWRDHCRQIVAGVLFIALVLAPMLGFIPLYTFIYTWVADHYQYLACVGLIAIFSAIVLRNWNGPRANALLHFVAPAGILLALGTLTWRQAHIYQNSANLWLDVLKKNPDSWMAYNNYGMLLLDDQDYPDALKAFQTARRLNPRLSQALVNIGNVAERRGDFDAAIRNYRDAAEEYESDPAHHGGWADPYVHCGVVYTKMKRSDDAIAAYQAALQRNPRHTIAMTNLGALYADRGNYAKAIDLYLQSLKLDPDSIGTRSNLAFAYLRQGMLSESAEQWNRVLELDPNSADAANGLGLIFANMGKWDEAINMFNAALRRNPNHEPARKNLEQALRENNATH